MAVGIIFDLDNTLVASSIDFAALRQDVMAMLEQVGIEITAEQRRWPVARLAQKALAPDREDEELFLRIWQLIDEYEVAGMHRASLEDGARELTSALVAQGIPLAIVTNNSRASALTALREFSLLDPFRIILARDDVPALKPAPDGLLLAKKRLGSPSRLIMIGDAWLDGVAAEAAGALFVAVGDYKPGPQPCPVWRHVKGLPELLHVDWKADVHVEG